MCKVKGGVRVYVAVDVKGGVKVQVHVQSSIRNTRAGGGGLDGATGVG